MPGSWPPQHHPHLLPGTFEITSECDPIYNCFAWAAGDNEHWWCPGEDGYWPDEVPRELTIATLVQVYENLGYKLCVDGTLTSGLEKLAIFGNGGEGEEEPTHAALQLESGEWTSKMGPLEDIRHNTPDAVQGPLYGRIICFMSRIRKT